MADAISGFPFLATLATPDVVNLDSDSPGILCPPPGRIMHTPPSRLVHIKLASGCKAEAVGWICKGSPIPDIQTVETEYGMDSMVLEKLFRTLGGGLRHLIIHIGSYCAFAHFWARVVRSYFLFEHHSGGYLRSICPSPHREHCP